LAAARWIGQAIVLILPWGLTLLVIAGSAAAQTVQEPWAGRTVIDNDGVALGVIEVVTDRNGARAGPPAQAWLNSAGMFRPLPVADLATVGEQVGPGPTAPPLALS
jgi:hypothetical protein